MKPLLFAFAVLVLGLSHPSVSLADPYYYFSDTTGAAYGPYANSGACWDANLTAGSGYSLCTDMAPLTQSSYYAYSVAGTAGLNGPYANRIACDTANPTSVCFQPQSIAGGATPPATSTPAVTSCSSVTGGICRIAPCATNYTVNANLSCTDTSEVCCIPETSDADADADADADLSDGSGSIVFQNPLRYNTVQAVLAVFLMYTQGVIVTIALVFLVLGGIFYIFSAGDEKRSGTAKKMIFGAMIGLAIGIAAPSFLREIAEILDWGNETNTVTGENNIPTEVQSAPTLMDIASNLLNFLLAMVGILAILMIVIGGLMYFAAAGDEKRADTAKGIVTYAMIGVAVALVSLIIVRTIAGFFATT